MLPFTVPFKSTLGANTEPSMQPCSLTDKKASPAAWQVTLPLM